MPTANLSFLPWVRQGAAAAISVSDKFLANQPLSTTVTAKLSLNETPLPDVPIRLRGPADVLGIDPNQVVRTDPRPNAPDFESNCFASIEFDRADFPWLFTPLARSELQLEPAPRIEAERLRPWLALVVVRKQPGVTIDTPANAALPTLRIAAPAQPDVELQSLTDSWAWAHTQVAANADATAVGEALNGGPELSLSRLVCPRILAPDTEYIACVVPAFAAGRRAGLGEPPVETDLTPAWSFPLPGAAPHQLTLPIYYRWEFRTGSGGDFETIARGLTPASPVGLGQRTIDISEPGFAAAGATTIELEGALKPLDALSSPAPNSGFQTALATILNAPDQIRRARPTGDPTIGPPIYGQWHGAQPTVTPGAQVWVDQLNLDPRWRLAAAMGTRVVQEHQEALMASAWDQAAEIDAVNQRVRQIQVSLAVGEIIQDRHFAPLSEARILQVAGPAFARLRQQDAPGGVSLRSMQETSSLPVAANGAAMRRLIRPRGPLSRRVASQSHTRSPDAWIAWLASAEPPAQPPPTPPARAFCTITNLPTQNLPNLSFDGAFFVTAENAPPRRPDTPVSMPTTEAPGFFRAAALKHQARALGENAASPASPPPALPPLKDIILACLHPRATLAAVVDAAIDTGGGVLPPSASGVPASVFSTVMAAPRFPTPMYEPLRDLSQDLLLPGLQTVPAESVVALQTNRRFVESYMVGLNHEMSRELLWRGFPTDQRGTSFARFWAHPASTTSDIDDLHTWSRSHYGHHYRRQLGMGQGGGEQFVLLLRSRLFARYPNAVVYAAPAVGRPDQPNLLVPSTATPVWPMFSGAMEPDVRFFGFPITPTEAIGGESAGPGYFVIIQEHPTEPRFGIDFNPSSTVRHLSHAALFEPRPDAPPQPQPPPPPDAAQVAVLTRRRPARIALHASRLILPTAPRN